MTAPAKLAYNVAQCAEVLGRSEKQVRAAINAGQLPAEKAGRSYVIPVWAVEQYLDNLVPRHI